MVPNDGTISYPGKWCGSCGAPGTPRVRPDRGCEDRPVAVDRGDAVAFAGRHEQEVRGGIVPPVGFDGPPPKGRHGLSGEQAGQEPVAPVRRPTTTHGWSAISRGTNR
jgi:hypothetical protein